MEPENEEQRQARIHKLLDRLKTSAAAAARMEVEPEPSEQERHLQHTVGLAKALRELRDAENSLQEDPTVENRGAYEEAFDHVLHYNLTNQNAPSYIRPAKTVSDFLKGLGPDQLWKPNGDDDEPVKTDTMEWMIARLDSKTCRALSSFNRDWHYIEDCKV
jgi:hypothetical protein